MGVVSQEGFTPSRCGLHGFSELGAVWVDWRVENGRIMGHYSPSCLVSCVVIGRLPFATPRLRGEIRNHVLGAKLCRQAPFSPSTYSSSTCPTSKHRCPSLLFRQLRSEGT